MAETGDIRIDEIMPQLLKEWATIPFQECLENQGIRFKKLKKKEIKSKGKYPVIDQGEKDIAGFTDDENSLYIGVLPIVIFGDHTRRVKFVDFRFAVGADGTKLLHPFSALRPKFFYYYLRSLNLISQGYSRHYRFLKEIHVPIPPHNEQQRIVAKLEKLLQKVNACKERLDKIPAILKRFRQSVLAAACSGNLTADWREKNPGVQPASELIEKFRDDQKREVKNFTNEFHLNSHDLPTNWVWASLIEVCGTITDGDHQPPPKAKDGIPFLVISNINKGRIDFSNTRYVRETYFASIKESRKPKKGDILYSVVGSYGIPVLVNTERPFCFQRHIALIRPANRINTQYCWIISTKIR